MAKSIIESSRLNEIKKVLIVGQSNIGDVFCNLTIIKPIREHFPRAKVYFISSPRTRTIVEGYKGIDKVIILDKKNEHNGLFGRIRFHYQLKQENFDLVIVLKPTLMHKFLNLPYQWDIRSVFRKDFVAMRRHPVDMYIEFFRSKGVKFDEPVLEFNLEKEEEFCEGFLREQGIAPDDRLVGILPLAAWSLKNWPIAKWNRLAQVLKQKYAVKSLAFGKSSDDKFSRDVMANMSGDIISAIDKTSLKQAMALLTRCNIFIGPDSSLLHLASLLRVESIGLFGPTPVEYMFPYFHRHNVIGPKEKPGTASCLANHHPPFCSEAGEVSLCMDKITVDEVLDVIKAILKL